MPIDLKKPIHLGRKKRARQSLVRGLIVGVLMSAVSLGQVAPVMAQERKPAIPTPRRILEPTGEVRVERQPDGSLKVFAVYQGY